MRRVMLIGFLLLAGCESDADKLDLLRREHGFATLDVLVWEQRVEDATDSVRRRALEDTLRVARDELLLAERDLNRFLR